MFVKFQKRKSDGRRPYLVETGIACSGACNGGNPCFIDPDEKRKSDKGWTRVGRGQQRYFRQWDFPKEWHCKAKPRCRWRIGPDGANLAPYTFLVSLAENKREGGKVRQTHIADLGAFDAHMLSSFYDGVEPQLADAARGDLEQWRKASLRARMAFWHRLEEKLQRLSNRMDADDVDKVRAAVHQRIPQPTKDEIAQNTAWMAAETIAAWQNTQKLYKGHIEGAQRQIAQHESFIEGCKEEMAVVAPASDAVEESVRILGAAMINGDYEAVIKSGGACGDYDMAILKLLSAHIGKP
jgi:hypothetical protein